MIDPIAKKVPRHRRPSRQKYLTSYRKTHKAEQAAATRRSRLKSKYGITPEQYDAILAHQKGVCAICERPPKKNALCVDHDHKTLKVRGLLCFQCNYFRVRHIHTPQLAYKLIDYFNNNPADFVLTWSPTRPPGEPAQPIDK